MIARTMADLLMARPVLRRMLTATWSRFATWSSVSKMPISVVCVGVCFITQARWDEPPRIPLHRLRGYIYATKEHNGQVTIRSAHCRY